VLFTALTFHIRHSGQLHAIAAKMDAGEGYTRPATSGAGDRNTGVGESHCCPGDSNSHPVTDGDAASEIDPSGWSSRARGATAWSRSSGALGNDSAINPSLSFRSKADGQLAFQETKRRLAKQASPPREFSGCPTALL
jgi:hypothetical protein